MADVGEKELKAVAKAMKVVEFSSGQVIVNQGDVGNTFYIIENGIPPRLSRPVVMLQLKMM